MLRICMSKQRTAPGKHTTTAAQAAEYAHADAAAPPMLRSQSTIDSCTHRSPAESCSMRLFCTAADGSASKATRKASYTSRSSWVILPALCSSARLVTREIASAPLPPRLAVKTSIRSPISCLPAPRLAPSGAPFALPPLPAALGWAAPASRESPFARWRRCSSSSARMAKGSWSFSPRQTQDATTCSPSSSSATRSTSA
mmetsp:Transcript_18526/g.59126  ORF Transcript_18526/g.59126 Transcript_18526/m.59126 type:complete len:200 (+) Transcript_18526:324-923(+)